MLNALTTIKKKAFIKQHYVEFPMIPTFKKLYMKVLRGKKGAGSFPSSVAGERS